MQGSLYHNTAKKIIFVPSNVDLATLEYPLAEKSVFSYNVEVFKVPKNITNISAFYFPNLTEITFHFPVEPLTKETFKECPNLVWIYFLGYREDFWTIAPPEPYNRDHWMNRVNIRYLGPEGWRDQLTTTPEETTLPPEETALPTPESTIEPALPEETAPTTPQSGCGSTLPLPLALFPAAWLLIHHKRRRVT